MSGSDVEHVSGFVDAGPPRSPRLSLSSTTDRFYDALSDNGAHDPSLTLSPPRPTSPRSGTTYTTQEGVSDPQRFALPATVAPNGYPNNHQHRSSPDPDEYYRSHSPTLPPGDDPGIRAAGGSQSKTPNPAVDVRSVNTSQPRVASVPTQSLGLSRLDLGKYRSVSDTSRLGQSDFPSGPSPVRPSTARPKQASFKDLINKFNNNVDHVLPVPIPSAPASREQSRASSPAPIDHGIRPRAASRRRDTGSSITRNQTAPRRDSPGDLGRDPQSHFALPVLNTTNLNNGSLGNHQPSNLLPRRPLFGELLSIDRDFQGYEIPSHLRRRGSEGSIATPNPAYLDSFDSSSAATPLTPTAWYLGRTPFLEAVSTGENSSRHRRTRSDIPGNSPVGVNTHPFDFDMAVPAPLHPSSRTSMDSPHSKSRIPVSSRRLNSPAPSDDSSPSPKAHSPIRHNTQTHIPPKGLSRLPKPSPKSAGDLVSHGQPAFPTTTTPTPTRGRREMGYGRSRTKLPEKSPLLEAYIAAPPPKKSPPLRSSRPRQPVSHNSTAASRSRVGETVSNLQKQIHREREVRNPRPRERRLPELGNVDFATRRQKIQQAFNRTVKENERREEEAAELRRRASVQENLSKPNGNISHEPKQSAQQPAAPESVPQPDDTTTVIEESTEPCEDETPDKEGVEAFPQLHVNTNVPNDNSHATTMDSPTLGHPILAQEDLGSSKPTDMPPESSTASCSEDSPVTTFDPEPQTAISQQDVHTSHRTLLSEIMRIRESSPSSSSCDEQEYGFSDNDEKEPVPILLRDKLAFDGAMHGRTTRETSDLYAQRNPNAGDISNRWSMGSWSSSLRHQHSTDDQCDGSGDDLSQLHQSPENSELVTQSCSASSMTPSDAGKHDTSPPEYSTGVGHQPTQDDASTRQTKGHAKTPSLAKLGGWDSKKITQLYLEELARGRDHTLPLDVRRSPEPRPPTNDLRADGGTDSLADEPVMVSRVDAVPASHRNSHSASLVLRDDWEHASPSIMNWMQIAADDAPARQDQTDDTSPQNDSAPTPTLATSNSQLSHIEDGNTGLGLAINIQSPQEPAPEEPSVPPMPLHEPPPPPTTTQTDTGVFQEPLERVGSIPPTQQPMSTSESTTFAPLGPVHSAGSSEDSLRRHTTSSSPKARDSSATSLVPSSVEQPRPGTSSSPSPDQRRLKKRRHVIKELVDTEYTFGRDMKVVDDIYKGTSSSCLDLSADDIKILFANSDQIVQFSMLFQDALKEAAKSVYVMPKSQRWSSKRGGRTLHASKNDPETSEGVVPTELEKDRTTSIGQAFMTHIANMEKVYAEYLKNHDAANKKLQVLQQSTNVSIWLNECREWASDLTSAWDLDSLLVKPVQRILKYPLLISELLDSTPSDHPDHALLVKALDEVTSISVRINEMKRRADVVGQVVGRKRKESDVRIGLSKAFGRRTEKLRQQVGLSDMVADKDYDSLAQRFGDNFFQLQVVMRDAETYTRETQESMERFLEFVSSIEAFIDVFQTSYPELEGKWRVFKISVQDIMAGTLPEHVSIGRMMTRDDPLLIWVYSSML